VATQIAYRHRLDELAVLMARARTEGIAYTFVHPAVLVTAADLSWADKHEVNCTTYAADRVGWRAEDTIGGSSVGTRLRELSGSIPGMAPWGIFPLAAEDIADLLMCRFAYVVTLRPERLVPDFRTRGITLKFPTGTERDAVFLHAHRDGDTVTVSSHLREQMLRELMTVETLVEIVDVLLQDLRHGGDVGSRTIMCDETNAWHRAPVYAGSLAAPSAVGPCRGRSGDDRRGDVGSDPTSGQPEQHQLGRVGQRLARNQLAHAGQAAGVDARRA
jgi:hypothetical protein